MSTAKLFAMKIFSALFFCPAILVMGCGQPQSVTVVKPAQDSAVANGPADTASTQPSVRKGPTYLGKMDSTLLTRSNDVLRCLKEKRYGALAQSIHPKAGVRFSPYAYVDPTADIHLSADEFLAAARKSKKLEWGSFDGTGENITLGIDKYFDRFVYDADFLNAEKIGINDMIGAGNSLNNLEEVYKGLPFVEYYFSGFDKKFEGMDWRCLRLVFKKHDDGKLYLVAVVHDEWTI